ncbi:kunitz trypsin inhibitor 5-like [Diospyros lotus]|uniref:kunitz trypsin inhibitor 5-like n=1 Tax=Diospyros lotus TaxID=55363 RepID=UPI002256C4DA|nr:kunitz trypsin inhibitor 5-like [Diospyros lotus]
MPPTGTAALITWLLISAFVTFSVAASDDAVLDTEGQPLRPGVNYYTVAAEQGNGGGLKLGSTASCPPEVVQDPDEANNGLPLSFSPVDPNQTVVPLYKENNIKFSAATVCAQSTVWRLGSDESTGERLVRTGGEEGNPGKDTLGNWFNIVDDGDAYKLVYCPTVCSFCRPNCGELGIFESNDGTRHLAISEVPIKVVFKKAD